MKVPKFGALVCPNALSTTVLGFVFFGLLPIFLFYNLFSDAKSQISCPKKCSTGDLEPVNTQSRTVVSRCYLKFHVDNAFRIKRYLRENLLRTVV